MDTGFILLRVKIPRPTFNLLRPELIQRRLCDSQLLSWGLSEEHRYIEIGNGCAKACAAFLRKRIGQTLLTEITLRNCTKWQAIDHESRNVA